MRRAFEYLLLIPFAAALAAAQAPGPVTEPADAANPVARISSHRSWEAGPFANGGMGLGNRTDYGFFSLGVEAGKVITPPMGAGLLRGQLQLAGNIMPLWQAYTPPPHQETFLYPCSAGTCYFVGPEGGGTYTGLSITPVIFRWNLLTRSSRFQPWVQAAGGLVYTTHKFPPDLLVPHGTPGGTSVFNFTPQGGGGLHWFVAPKRSLDVGLNAIHISSASLGDRNPGVNASLQVQVGYTFWK